MKYNCSSKVRQSSCELYIYFLHFSFWKVSTVCVYEISLNYWIGFLVAHNLIFCEVEILDCQALQCGNADVCCGLVDVVSGAESHSQGSIPCTATMKTIALQALEPRLLNAQVSLSINHYVGIFAFG